MSLAALLSVAVAMSNFQSILSPSSNSVVTQSMRNPSAPFQPADPATLFETTRVQTDRRAGKFPVLVETTDGEILRGLASFGDDAVQVRPEGGAKRALRFEDVRSLTFKRFTGKARGDGAWDFHCARFDVELRTGKVLRIYEPLPVFEKFRIEPEGRGLKPRTLYGWFVDYQRNGKWVNTGLPKKGDPGEKPIAGVIRRIVFED